MTRQYHLCVTVGGLKIALCYLLPMTSVGSWKGFVWEAEWLEVAPVVQRAGR